MNDFLANLLGLSLEAAPWLVLGLIIGGLIKALVPTSFLQKHLSGSGFSSVVKAAFFGAPLPLCSCGVVPVALGMRRAGASKPATVSFLVSTPETGIDSVTISYALLGPFMAIVRPIAAITSAIVAGLLVGRSEDEHVTDNHVTDKPAQTASSESCCSSKQQEPVSCCAPKVEETTSCCAPKVEETTSCCAPKVEEKTSCCSASNKTNPEPKKKKLWQEIWSGIVYSFSSLFVDVLFWLSIGLVFAALVKTFVPMTFLAAWGSGLPAMLVMLVIGIPMYVCATASTPLAAGLLLAGVSPGTAMVFLMAGPATNISTLGIIGKELGRRSLVAYLTGVTVVSLLTGFIVDYLVKLWSLDVQGQIAHSHEMVPPVIAWAALILLIGVTIKLKKDAYFSAKV